MNSFSTEFIYGSKFKFENTKNVNNLLTYLREKTESNTHLNKN